MSEVEGFGVDYERYALGKLLYKLARKHEIGNVLEIPAAGAKAMPSIYSLGFGMAGCDVILLNGDESRMSIWEKLGLKNRVTFKKCADIEHTQFEDDYFDIVWNFAVFPQFRNPQAVIAEMIRVSCRYIAVFSVNGYNMGFPIHRLVHNLTKIPWTHGNIHLNYPSEIKQLFQENGLKKIKIGLVDCPPWPDSLGFRDVRLHRSNRNLANVDWYSKFIDYILEQKYPKWMKIVYFFESIPVPKMLKMLYSHIFYVLGEKGK